MSQDLLQRAEAIAAGAARRGAQGVRAAAHRRRHSTVEWRDGKLDRLRESTALGISVELFVDGRYSSNSTSDLRPEALERFLDETVAMTRVLAPDEHRKLPDPARYRDRFAGDLGLVDRSAGARLDGAERRRLAAELEQAARAAPGAGRIVSVTASWSDSLSEGAMVCSNGMQIAEQATRFSMVAEVSVEDQGGRKPEGYHWADCRKRKDLPAAGPIGQEATRRALQMVGAGPQPSGQYPCVIENRQVGRLLSGLLGPLAGRNIQQKRSFLAAKLGEKVASEHLTLVDDPHVPGGLGSTIYDAEGMATRKLPLFEAGVLKSFLLDTYYASKLGRKPTFGQTTNLVLPPGERDLPGLLAAMDRGILVTGFSGGNSNPATGDFSVGIRGQWIEGGKPVRPLAEMNLSGNHLSFWQKLAELGADVNRYSSLRSPSLRFEPVQFSGS